MPFSDCFIRKSIPSFEVPEYQGKRYEVMAPDTLDKQDRIRLAVNGLTNATDPEKDHLIHFRVNFRSHPPSMSHSKSDICQMKFMESLPLMRLADGSRLNTRVDPVCMATALRMIGPDGLAYWPGFSWGPLPDWAQPADPKAGQYAVPHLLRTPDRGHDPLRSAGL